MNKASQKKSFLFFLNISLHDSIVAQYYRATSLNDCFTTRNVVHNNGTLIYLILFISPVYLTCYITSPTVVKANEEYNENECV